jgi:hypothetical protein
MPQTDYRTSWNSARAAEGHYLTAVASAATHGEELAALAISVREAWAAVATLCASGEAAARAGVERVPRRHRRAALREAWQNLRDWSVRSEEAATRGSMFGALLAAHLGRRPDLSAAAAAAPATAPMTVDVTDERIVQVVS